MKKNKVANHKTKRIISLVAALCMLLSIVPITAFAEDTRITVTNIAATITAPALGQTPDYAPVIVADPADSVDLEEVYWYKIAIADFTGTDEDVWDEMASDETYTTGYYYSVDLGLRTEDGYKITETTTGTVNGMPHDDTYCELYDGDSYAYLTGVFEPLHANVINNVVINNAPTSCIVGEAPKAMAAKGDNEAYTFYEYWEGWNKENVLVGEDPDMFWYSDEEQMNRVPADKRITTFEEGKSYSYSIIAEANENYTFASQGNLSVTMNGEDYKDKSEVILDGAGLMMGPKFMTPKKPATQKEIVLIEINGATLSFKAGDEPVFTGTTPDGAPYVLDYESWFGEDGKFISSSDYWNSAYVERDWCDGLISSFSENIEYTYGLYVKLTDEAAARGYVFGPNTKLKINGKDADYVHSDETSIALQIMSELTMTPSKTATQKEIPVVEINNATLTFKDGDNPVFTGTTPDDAPYALVFEEWRTDGEWTRSDEWFNDADHHGSDKDITAFDKNKSYNYNLYIKLNSKGWEDGWYFGPNTKLKINGKEFSFTFINNDPGVFMVTTGITMTPTAAGASDYKIIEGANGAWTQNSDGTLVFRANGDFSKFTGVKIDGTLIDTKNYTAVSGSTVITLKADYLKTLSVGEHNLTVVYTDGECSTSFDIEKPSAQQTDKTEKNAVEAKSPETGNDMGVALLGYIAFAGCVCVAVIIVSKKKKVR